MKKHIGPFKLLTILMFLAAPFVTRASDGDNVGKKKNISKSYTVSAEDKLSIVNSFGDVVVTTWDKKEIQVDIVIGVNAATEEKAQHMLDGITVSDSRGGNDIRFKTDVQNMGNGKKNNDGGDQRRFYVDYKVSMPAGNPLDIENSFGKINIGDFNGPINLTSKFGELTAGSLPNAKILHVEFGKASIGPVANPDVTFKFNSSSVIKNISGTAKVHVEFSGNVEFGIDNSIKDLTIAESYSNLRLNVPSTLPANIQVHTNFGSFENSSGIAISEDREDDNGGPKFDRDYSGNKGENNARIRIRSSFGKIHLANVGDAADNDDGNADDANGNEHKQKNKNKNKDKDKSNKDDKDDDSGNVNL
jgi:hypothetical protein